MSTDLDTYAAILADAARLADGGNLQAAAAALRSALEIDFQQVVVDVLLMFESAISGELDPEIALAAIEELTEIEISIEVDDSEVGVGPDLDGPFVGEPTSADDAADPILAYEATGTAPAGQGGEAFKADHAGEGLGSRDAGPQSVGSSPPDSVFQMEPMRPIQGMSLSDLKTMLTSGSAGTDGRTEAESPNPEPELSPPGFETPLPEPEPAPDTELAFDVAYAEDSLTAEVSDGADDQGFDRGPSDASTARFRGAVPPAPAHRYDALTPVKVESKPVGRAVEDDGEFDFFGAVSPEGSHLDVQPEVVTEGSLADAIGGSTPMPGGPEEPPVGGRTFGGDSGETQRIPGRMNREGRRLPREPFPAGRNRSMDSSALTPTAGEPLVTDAAYRTGRMRPVEGDRTSQPINDLLDRVRVLLGRGDLASAQELAKEVLLTEPGHGDAQALAQDIAARLMILRVSTLEPMNRVPRQSLGEVIGTGLNPRSMFVLSMADGSSSLEDLVDLSGMSRSDALELLAELVETGALVF